MTHLSELMDIEELRQAIDAGYVRCQIHPTLPYDIYNYSEKSVFDRFWTPVTRQCRGLIVHTKTGEVLARPFAKFFNYSEPLAPVIELDEPVQVLDKVDGCFPGGTTLNLWGGGTTTIGRVVRDRLPVTLVGMDSAGNLVPAVVTDWHHNGRKDHWLDIEVDSPVSRTSGARGCPNRLRVTVNHHIAVDGEYRPACEIQVGDVLVTQGWEPDGNAIRLIRASLLGDGCVTPSFTRPEHAKYQESHSEKQEAYALALRKALGSCAANRADTVSGYGSRMVWAGSREYRALGEMRAEWYPNGVKVVPADLSWLDDFAVAKWLMDDGYRQRFARQADRICFSTHSFTELDIRRLGDRLIELYGVSYHLVQDKGRGFSLVINSGRQQQLRTLWAAVAPHVHPSMHYKLPEEFRDVPYIELTPAHELTVPRPARVLSINSVALTKRNFPSGRTGFDVTTTTHNYLARGVLVHNSLGILYPTGDGGHAIATRGSFTSDQAQHATALYQDRYAGRWSPAAGFTYLFEIVYPENRIVVRYDMDDLVLLGAVRISTGIAYLGAAESEWPGPTVKRFEYETLAEALAAPPRDGQEGLVVTTPTDPERRIKIKYEEYVRLHRIVTGLNARAVWEALGAGQTAEDICAELPDEFHEWTLGVARDLFERTADIMASAEIEHERILASLPEGHTRKDYALIAKEHDLRAYLFKLADNRDIREQAWKAVYPEGNVTPSGRTFTEATA